MNATAEIINTDIPTPKYRIGQKVFHASTFRTTGKYPCPDCLGSGKWEVTTPAGSKMIAGCQRCGPHSSTDIPSLVYEAYAPSVQSLTIGSVQIDTAALQSSWREDPVRYMCVETGVGSGSVYDEKKLFATEEEALRVAEIKAAEENAKCKETPQRLEKERVHYLKIEDANMDQFKNGLWRSWYKYRNLREKLEEWVKDDGATIDDIRWEANWELDADTRANQWSQVFERIIAAAVKSDDPELRALIAELPFKPLAERVADENRP